MKNVVAAFLLFASLFVVPAAFPQDVDRGELESASSGANMVFVNYEGPYAVIDSLKAIKSIGEVLGSGIDSAKGRVGDPNRYSVIRAIDPVVTLGFDADIFILGKGVGVDHIKSLRVIIGGYLEKAFGYSEKDALLLAEFITVYNAVYRGNWNYFASKYKQVVLGSLEPGTAGLSLKYDEWPGMTKIAIPLSSGVQKGNLGAVSTGSLTESAVVEELRKSEDKGIGTRQEMVDLKEREIVQDKKKAEAEKAKIVEEKGNLAKEKENLAKEKAKLEETKKVREEKTDPTGDTLVEKPNETVDKALVKKEAEVAKKETEIVQREKALETQEEKATEAEKAVALKEEEVKTEREEIRKDQEETIKEENFPDAAKPPETPGKTVVLLQALSLTNPFASLVSVDLGTGKVKSRSKLNTIRTRTLVEIGSGYAAIAGRIEGSGAVRLVSIDAVDLQTKAQGGDDLFYDSFLSKDGEDLYAIVSLEGSFYLGRFGSDLSLQAKSAQSVHPYTALVFDEGGLIVQGQDGAFYILSPEDLGTKKRIE